MFNERDINNIKPSNMGYKYIANNKLLIFCFSVEQD